VIIVNCLLMFIAVDDAGQPRPLDPKKDLAVYGYGTVAWKERMEEWKKKQNEKLQVVKHQGGDSGRNHDGDEPDDPDLPM
jgi:cellulose synthase A